MPVLYQNPIPSAMILPADVRGTGTGIFLDTSHPLIVPPQWHFRPLRMKQGVRIRRIQTCPLPSVRGLSGRESFLNVTPTPPLILLLRRMLTT